MVGIETASSLILDDVSVSASGVGIRIWGLDPGPLVTAVETRVSGAETGIRIERGTLRLARSWVGDVTGDAIDVDRGKLELSNTVVARAALRGVLVRAQSSAAIEFSTITACSVGVSNQASSQSVLLTTSIVRGNALAEVDGVPCAGITFSDGDPACCDTGGNLCADPEFLDPFAWDFRIGPSSPCADAAFPPQEYAGQPAQDLDGGPRLLDASGDGLAQADCGAFEAEPTPGAEPGDVQGLAFADPATLVWNAEPLAEAYNVYRAALSALGYDDPLECRASALAEPIFEDLTEPRVGEGFAYLVTATAGDKEGTLGYGSGAERSNFAPCP